MADTGSGAGRCGGQGARRARQQPGRHRRVHFSLTEQEFAVLEDAAGRAGLARGAFAAQVVLAHVTGSTAGLVRRIGVNLNQAVAKLNATGQRPGELLAYARESMRRAERLDEAAEQVRKALR